MSRLVINKYSPDKKYLSVLFTFLAWLIVGFIVCFVGINNIFAASYDANNFTAQLYDNLGPTLNAVTTSKEENGSLYYYGFIGLTANSSGGAWGISSPIPLIANHTYSMTVDPYAPGCGYTILSSYPRLGVGTSFANAKASYQNNTYVEEKFYQAISNSKYLQYVFTPIINASYIVFPYATTISCSSATNQLSTIVIEDLGESGVSQDQINTSLTNQTNELNTSIENSTNTITGAITDTEDNINSNIDDMEQNIIDSNKETQEVIKDQFNSCRPGNNLFNLNNWYNSLTSNNGTISLNEDSIEFIAISNSMTNIISSYNFKLKPSTTYTLSFNANIENSFEYNTWLNLGLEAIDNVSYGTLYINSNGYYTKTFTTNQNGDFYLKGYVNTNVNNNNQVKLILNNIMLNEGSSAKTYEKYGEICSNKLDEAEETRKGIWQTIKELPSMFLDMLLGLFIPEDLSFIDNFKDVISNKLGFIASVPIQIIDFALGLADVAFDEITTISFPSFEVFGVRFWNAEDIDITILLEKLKPFKYFTDLTCVILCCRTLYDLYHNFTGGGAN